MASENRMEVYRDEGGQFRWRHKAANNKITGSSGESFSSEDAAIDAAFREQPDLPVYLLGDQDRVKERIGPKAEHAEHVNLPMPPPVGRTDDLVDPEQLRP